MCMEYVYPAKLPWPTIMDDLKAKGCAYHRQAILIGVPWSTYQRWMAGEGEPRHSQGVAILALHTTVCGAELTRQRQREGTEQV